jgi:predicted aspartyl protease
MDRSRRAWAAVALCAGLSASYAHGACKIAQISELRVARVGNRPMIDGQINEQPIKILVDTGSYDSFISGGAARRLNLPIRDNPGPSAAGRGIGGETQQRNTVVERLKIDRFSADGLRLNVTVSKLGEDPNSFAFVLGSDFFAHFTTEFDLAHGAIRLLRPDGCKPEQLVYWDQAYFLADLERMSGADHLMYSRVLVNGTRARAVLDTGATMSFISIVAARSAGVKPGDPGVEESGPVTGLAGAPIPTWVGRFDTFSFGNETVRNAKLRIGDLFGNDRDERLGSHIAQVSEGLPELILGADFFQAHRIVILPSEHTALFTYNGGPVFQVRRPNESPAEAPPPPLSSQ